MVYGQHHQHRRHREKDDSDCRQAHRALGELPHILRNNLSSHFRHQIVKQVNLDLERKILEHRECREHCQCDGNQWYK